MLAQNSPDPTSRTFRWFFLMVLSLLSLGQSRAANETADAFWVGLGGTNGSVSATTLDASGNLYVGGSFSAIGGFGYGRIAKWNGTAWSAFGAGLGTTTSTVNAIAVSGSYVYAGGFFTAPNGDHISRWDGTAWSAFGNGLNSGTNGTVYALAVNGSDLYVAGNFTSIANLTNVGGVAKWNGTAWSALDTGIRGGYATSLALVNGSLYAGGAFTSAGQAVVSNLAKWDGVNWTSVGEPNSTVSCLKASGSDLYIGGTFTSVNGVAASRIAKYNGSTWSALGSGVATGSVKAIEVSGASVYVGGSFSTAGGDPGSFVMAWNGSAWSSIGSGTSDQVNALALKVKDLYVGGNFTTVGANLAARGVALYRIPETVTFASATQVPITAAGYDATARGYSIALGFAPTAGTNLTLVNNTSRNPITGRFTGLAQGQAVSLSYAGLTYNFIANYYGGTGNDLVLHWANTRRLGWGQSDVGQTGIGSMPATTTVPTVVNFNGSLEGKTIASGASALNHSLAVCADGTLAGWGWNRISQLAPFGTNSSPALGSMGGALSGKTPVAVAVGEEHSLVLCSDGSIVAFGANTYGELGNGFNSQSDGTLVSTAGVLSGKTVIAISAGQSHSLALCSDGTLAAWGRNNFGQLGNNSTTNSNVPVAVTLSGALSGKTVTAIACGALHNVVLCNDNTLASWGSGNFGQLGNNSTAQSSVPVTVLRYQNDPSWNKTIVAIAAGENHSALLNSDGTVGLWGRNTYGELGTGNNSHSSISVSPVTSGALSGKVVTSLACGAAHTFVTCSDGTAVTWGRNTGGQLGNSSTTNSNVPVAVTTTSLLSGERFSLAFGGSTANHSIAVTGVPPSPTATTLAASSLSNSGATLNGSVNANGNSASVVFDYGTTTSYGTNVVASQSPVSGNTGTPVSAVLTGLAGGQVYHYRVRAVSTVGSFLGSDVVFTPPSNNANLTSLALSPGTLTTPFTSGTINYSANMPFATATFNVTATAETGATLTINGTAVSSGSAFAIPFTTGSTTVTIVSTSQDLSATKTYTIFVSRVSGVPDLASPTSASIAATTATLGATITATNGSAATASGVVFSPTATNANPQLNGAGVSSAVSSTSTGTFTVNVSGLTPGTAYTYAAYATNNTGTGYSPTGTFTTLSNNANLSGLVLSAGTLSPVFVSGTTTYTTSVPAGTASLTVTPTKADSLSSLTVNGSAATSGAATSPISLSPGLNNLSVVVTAQDNSTKTYTVTVTVLNAAPSFSLTSASGASVVTVDSGGSDVVGRYDSLALVNGNPAVAYYDTTNGDLKYVRATNAFGTAWGTPVTVDSAGNVGAYASLAVVNGNPAIAYYEIVSNTAVSNASKVKYVRATDASGAAWGAPVTIDAQTSQINLDETFALGSLSLKVVNGNPAVAYQEGQGPTTFETTNCYYCRATDASGTAWGTPLNLQNSGPTQGYFLRMEVAAGMPLVVDLQGSQGGLERFRALDANGDSWSGTAIVTPDQNWAPSGYPLYTGVNLSLAIVSDFPSVSYYEITQADLRYTRAMEMNGASWAAAGGPSGNAQTIVDSTGDVGRFSSLAVINGKPAISYYDKTNGNLKYVAASNAEGSAWGAPQTLDSDGDVGSHTSLAALASGAPGIAYFDATNGNLKFAVLNTGAALTTVAEDSGPASLPGFAFNLSAGPATESAQTLSFVVSNDNTALFSAQPALAANGTLTFTPALNAFGTAVVSLSLKDNGGTAAGGSDTSAVQTFTIVVSAVNDTPVVTLNGNSPLSFEAAASYADAGATASDPESGTLVPVQTANTVVANVPGSYLVTWTATDGAGVTASATRTVNVVDTTAPTIAPHADVTVPLSQPDGAFVTYDPAGATDAVGVTSLTYSQDSGTLFAVGVTTVTITAKDAANHTTTRTFTVTVSGADLSGLTASVGTLSPAFTPSVSKYDLVVSEATTSLTVTATAAPNLVLTVNGNIVSSGVATPITLNPGYTNVQVYASTPGGGFDHLYTIRVARGLVADIVSISQGGPGTIVSNGYTASGNLNLPIPYGNSSGDFVYGASLLLVNNTGPNLIQGSFTNLVQGQTVQITLPFGEDPIVYSYIVNYFGGTGNDLVLQWAYHSAIAWGDNGKGQLGNGGLLQNGRPWSLSPTFVSATSSTLLHRKTIYAEATGGSHSLALISDGTVASWGLNDSGQLGNNSTASSLVPVAVTTAGILAGKTVVAIAAGADHSLALCSDGTLVAWGSNSDGQLGNNSVSNSPVPFSINTFGALVGKRVTSIAAGSQHSLALCSDGTIAAWGANSDGQLGNNSTTPSLVPVPVSQSGVLSGKTVSALSAGAAHSLALCSDGSVASWGGNANGQLGNNSGVQSSQPVLVDVSGVLSGKSVVSIQAGGYHNLALCSDHSLVAWGRNFEGQVGDNSADNQRLAPVAVITSGVLSGKIITAVATGAYHSVALCSDGTAAAWGSNRNGRLGIGQITPSRSLVPVAVNNNLILARNGGTSSMNSAIFGGSSASHSLGLLADNGDDADLAALESSLGVVEFIPQVSPSARISVSWDMPYLVITPTASSPSATVTVNGVPVVSGFPSQPIRLSDLNFNGFELILPVKVTARNGVTSRTFDVRVNGASKLVLETPPGLTLNGGTGLGWGRDSQFQAQVPVAQFSALAAGLFHSVGLKSDGTVRAWGFNVLGQTNVPAGLTGVVAVDAANNYTMALKSDGTVLAWGSRPVVPGGLTQVKAIAAGLNHSLALKFDGTVVAWGDNAFGQLNVPAGLTGVTAISAGDNHSVALKADGTVVAWGDNTFGQRDIPAGLANVRSLDAGPSYTVAVKQDGTIAVWPASAPTPPAGLGGIIAVAAGSNHTLALKADGTVVGWGDNTYGQTTIPANAAGARLIAAGGGHSLALVQATPSYSLGTHSVGVGTLLHFSFRNIGNTPAQLLDFTVDGPFDFIALPAPGNLTLKGGESSAFVIGFNPVANGTRAATFRQAQSYPATPSPFNFTLTATATSPSAALSDWAAAAGLFGVNALPEATPYNDGVSNLLKYAFNIPMGGPNSGNPATSSGGMPKVTSPGAGTSGLLRVEFFRRRNSPVIYTPKRSHSPGSFVPMTGTPVVTVIDADWERVVVEEPVGTPAPSNLFVVVSVTLP